MRLKFKEDPKEWRKTALLTATGLAVLATVLCWRRVLPPTVWVVILSALVGAGCGACLRPRWFRGYYRLSQRLGFHFSQGVGYVILALFFLLVMTPLGLGLRLLRKDLLRLKRNQKAGTYWSPARETGSLDRLF